MIVSNINKKEYNLNDELVNIIEINIIKANKVLSGINIEKCIKENHECDKVKNYLNTL